MRPASAIFWSAVFLVIAPGTLAGYIPWAITDWQLGRARPPLTALGGLLIGGGLALLLECFARFALQGRGTPAPVAPPERLVVTGPYRRVRNPMYVAVVAIILGQAALFADVRLLVYALIVWLAFHAFVLLYEEPTLRRAFPEDYEAFTAAVPRWRPRLRPWRAPT
ncbi:isoprenylcysteine carboxylmethyltransferase family protein [Phenylobacterium sp.]|jgi:protein-S-isoprenylcysteine O-methyltransferase Ste14|uniref:methyltransferase family protein n=1 Tax=Phenylobacterium sp. TaxID=1871053 RepID=UPI002F40AEEF